MHPFNTAKKMKSTEKVVNYFKSHDFNAVERVCSPMKEYSASA